MANEEKSGNVRAAIEAGEQLAKMETVSLEASGDILIVHGARKVIDLRPFQDARLERPRRREGQTEHHTLDSFLDHNERTRDKDSVIFAIDNPTGPELLAIYDYNEQTLRVSYDHLDSDDAKKVVRVETEGRPRFGKHRARYAMPFSDEWRAWSKIAGPGAGWLGQLDFATALEDRGLEILPPSSIPSKTLTEATALGINAAGPTVLASLARGLMVRADRKVGSAVNLDTGEAKIVFEETHQATMNDAPVIVPNGFALSIPVFRDGDPYAVLVRLRHRVDGSAVKYKLAMHRPDVCFRDAFYDVTKAVKDKTGLPLFFGTPE